MNWGWFLYCLIAPPAVSACFWFTLRTFGAPVSPMFSPAFLRNWIACATFPGVFSAVMGIWPEAAGCAASAALALAIWWWKRRDRKRALEALGAKSRAIRARLVTRVRESAKPRPVLRPVPQGAGA